jgi:hypothetical protein
MAMTGARPHFCMAGSSAALVILMAACGATEGDVLRTRADAASGPVAARPRPVPGATFQIQLNGNVDTTVDASTFTIDLATAPSVFADLHAAGRLVMCFFSGGTYEPFRDDASRFPQAALGSALTDYPNERWIDVRDSGVRAVMSDRVTLAAQSGCDGIHAGNLDGYLQSTGFPLTENDQQSYDRWLEQAAHAVGMSAGLVDGDAALNGLLAADFDWAVVWSCIDAGCDAAAPFVAAGKPVFLVEFGGSDLAASVCPKAQALGLSAVIKNQSLDAFRGGCP